MDQDRDLEILVANEGLNRVQKPFPELFADQIDYNFCLKIHIVIALVVAIPAT